jgi:serine/threonine-protein kinase PknG
VKCERTDCQGAIVDGYCDSCGLAPATQRDNPPTTVIPSLWEPPRGSRRSSTSESRLDTPTTASRSSITASTAHRRLGGGLVHVPKVSIAAPERAVLSNPEVPERSRYCQSASCKEPVGRARDGEPGRAQGFCRQCGAPFSFVPKLVEGDLVAGQYEVMGCIGRGGMGWVYLARDRKVGFLVALKGVLHGADESARTAAMTERALLAEVEHPNIVKIYNFVEHAGDEYIVMEFVNGVSLQAMLDARTERNGGLADPLPVGEAIVYCRELLPALEYLHERGLAFCDFKPDNVIRTANSLKLIDLGGGYRMGSEARDIFGTPGFQAPEIARTGPSVASDLFTIARTLAVLTTDFAGFRGVYEYTLPPQSDVPLYLRFESFYRFLERATAFDPRDRFGSASDMADQLDGVLRELAEVLGEKDEHGTVSAWTSNRFTPQSRGSNDHPDLRRLPTPIVDPDDRYAGMILTLSAAPANDVVSQVDAVSDPSQELELWLVRALITLGRLGEASAVLEAIIERDTREWRVSWYRGVIAIADGGARDARDHFERVYRWLPGELAPKLALAMAAEHDGDHDAAAHWYEIVTRTDDAFTSAAFGLARCRLQLGDRAGACKAYQRVPESANSYVDARIGEVEVLLGDGATPALVDAVVAGEIVEATLLDRERKDALSARVLEGALQAIANGQTIHVDGSNSVLGRALTEHDLRVGLEQTYRSLGRRAATSEERVQLVDRANRVRPRSWW